MHNRLPLHSQQLPPSPKRRKDSTNPMPSTLLLIRFTLQEMDIPAPRIILYDKAHHRRHPTHILRRVQRWRRDNNRSQNQFRISVAFRPSSGQHRSQQSSHSFPRRFCQIQCIASDLSSQLKKLYFPFPQD